MSLLWSPGHPLCDAAFEGDAKLVQKLQICLPLSLKHDTVSGETGEGLEILGVTAWCSVVCCFAGLW